MYMPHALQKDYNGVFSEQSRKNFEPFGVARSRKELVMAVKNAVSGEQYRTIDRRVRAIKEQLDKRGGSPLDPEKVASALQLIVEGKFPKPLFARDMHKESEWELIEEGPEVPANLFMTELELKSFLKNDEHYITSEELQKRAVTLNANFGQHHAEWLLKHRKRIPKDWQGTYLVFPATLWRDRSGSSHMPVVSWSGKQWVLGFYWLDHRFSSVVRLLRPRA